MKERIDIVNLTVFTDWPFILYTRSVEEPPPPPLLCPVLALVGHRGDGGVVLKQGPPSADILHLCSKRQGLPVPAGVSEIGGGGGRGRAETGHPVAGRQDGG